MSRRVHIVGAGVVGSFLMRALEARGIEFSWWDSDFGPAETRPAFCAWKASTGCIYPSGESIDAENYERFEDSARRLGLEYEVARYCFSQNSIPHKGNSKDLKVVEQHGSLKFINKPSFHVNVQSFVNKTRDKFWNVFSNEPSRDGDLVVHAHGFHHALPTDYRWGWHVKAKVETPSKERVCFNLKEGRFVVAYLYPIPGSDLYYLGTHFLYQKKPKQVEIKDKTEKIYSHILSKTEDFVERIRPDWATLQVGWRPAYMKDEEQPAVISKTENGIRNLYLRPQMANGLRHHVTFLDEVFEELEKHL